MQSSVAFGPERTLEQDPMFAFRIIVDIALKALSPAINDPTTAVLALDQVHRLLRVVGQRKLRGEVIVDDSGRPRVIFRTPNWEHYVHVACSEIRACGAGNLQVARRMRAMLENLSRRCRRTATRRSTPSAAVSISRLQPPTRLPTIGSSPGFRTRRDWGARHVFRCGREGRSGSLQDRDESAAGACFTHRLQ